MIDALRFKNFKCFRDEIVRLGGLTVLAGLNGSGKSTVMQGLLVLRQSRFRAGRVGAREIDVLWQGPLVDVGNFGQVLSEDPDGEIIELEASSDVHGSVGARIRLTNDVERADGIETSSDSTGAFYRGAWFYLPADRLGPQETLPSLSPGTVPASPLGKTGEHVLWYLERNGGKAVPKQARNAAAAKPSLLSQTNAWLRTISPGAELRFVSVPNHAFAVPTFSFPAQDDERTRDFWATNVGFGLSYALPVVVALLAARSDDLVLIENPEAHLHPAGQTKIAELAARAVASGAQVILETHSDHVLDGVRLAVRDAILPPARVVLNYFERHGTDTRISTPTIGPDGRLDTWPPGFFDQQEVNLARLIEPHVSDDDDA